MNTIGASASTFGTSLLAAVSGMPWGLAAFITGGMLLVSFAAAVIPQESADRLAWWQSLWSRKAPPPSG